MGELKLTIKETLELAVKKHNEDNLKEAEILYLKILELDPNNSDALHLLGLIANQVGKYEKALELIKKAIKLKSNSAIYYSNLAMTYDSLGNDENSTKNFETALRLDPHYNKAHLAHYNLGVHYKDKENNEKALKHYNKAIELEKNFAEAHFNKGLILLQQGNLKVGFNEFKYRFKKKHSTDSRIFKKPQWNGEDLKNKRILIASEQGFGDDIQFIRYLKLIKEKQAYIILECKKELKELFENLEEIDELIEKTDTLPNTEFDYYTHLMDLPKIFNTTLETIPNKTPYLKVSTELVNKFKEKINSDKFKVGIVWQGNPNQENDKNRSTNSETFKILKELQNIQLYSLQKETSETLDDPEIIDLSKDINNFSDTAAIIENLDLIISVDTSVAHLAGALNKPTWVLLSKIADWRWLLNKSDCPWYPNMKLFRQKKLGDWDSLIDDISIELKKYINLN